MVAFIFTLILFFVFLLTYIVLKKTKLLNRSTKIILLVIFTFTFFLIFSQLLDTDSKKLGSGYTFVHGGSNNNYIFHEYPAKGGEIEPNVVSFDYNKQFIIVKQKPMPFQYAYETAKDYACRTDTIAFCYWLILKEDQKIFGPLDSIQFLKLRKDYGVPEKLKFKE